MQINKTHLSASAAQSQNSSSILKPMTLRPEWARKPHAGSLKERGGASRQGTAWGHLGIRSPSASRVGQVPLIRGPRFENHRPELLLSEFHPALKGRLVTLGQKQCPAGEASAPALRALGGAAAEQAPRTPTLGACRGDSHRALL